MWGARTYALFNRNNWVLALFRLLRLTVLVFGVHLLISRPTPDSCMSQPLCAVEVKATKCKYSCFLQNYALGLLTDLLAIFTIIYKLFSAVFTTLRSYQALQVRASEGVHTQEEGLTDLVFEEGMSTLNKNGQC